MKEKKNSKAKKVMLMVIASALVVAISVSATLAYLTAQTIEKDNVFKASPGIDGEVLEPNFDYTKTFVYEPGDLVSKDPIVQNRTDDAQIIVGARLDYYINVLDNAEANYVQVPYSTFKKYVDVIYNSAPKTNTNPTVDTDTFNTTNNSDGTYWTDITGTVDNSTYDLTDTNGRFFAYNAILNADNQSMGDGSEITQGSGTTSAEKLGNTSYVDTKTGNGDNTTPIFNQVRVNVGVNIGAKNDGTYTMLTGTTSNNVTTYAYTAESDGDKRTALSSAGDNLANSYFKVFNFKIKITAVGVKNDADLQSKAATQNPAGYVEAAQPYIIDDLKSGAIPL